VDRVSSKITLNPRESRSETNEQAINISQVITNVAGESNSMGNEKEIRNQDNHERESHPRSTLSLSKVHFFLELQYCLDPGTGHRMKSIPVLIPKRNLKSNSIHPHNVHIEI
jgi:hypothetical protein